MIGWKVRVYQYFWPEKSLYLKSVPNLILVPDFFDPQEIWCLRNLDRSKEVPKNFSFRGFGSRMIIITWRFHAGPKLLGDQISWGPKKSRPWTRLGTILVIAQKGTLFLRLVLHNNLRQIACKNELTVKMIYFSNFANLKGKNWPCKTIPNCNQDFFTLSLLLTIWTLFRWAKNMELWMVCLPFQKVY